ncbi:MAG: hypothetical protein AAGA80_28070, partial [Cyanobacteria bacterium P01_F01_bin.143]
LKRMIAPQLDIYEQLFTKINKSKIDKKEAYDKAMYLHEEMCNRKIDHSSYTCNLLIKYTPNNICWELYKSLERDERVSEVKFHVFDTLIRKVNTKEEQEIIKFVETKYPEFLDEIKDCTKSKNKKPIIKKKLSE